jgi:lysophospholipase L1-like esterase
MWRESLFFVAPTGGATITTSLLFSASEVLEIRRPYTGEIYTPGTDYVFDQENKLISLPVGSKIPTLAYNSLYPPYGSATFHHKDHIHDIYWAEGHYFHDLQVEITYEHPGTEWRTWAGPVHKSAASILTRTFAKLLGGQALNVVLLGDSISVGANASGFVGINVKPFSPPFGDLLVSGLTAQYGSAIQYTNLSVGGKDSAWGITMTNTVNGLNPDLVLIGFGMNDVNGGVSTTSYKNNMKLIMSRIRAVHPNCEFILIATMLANPEWEATSLSRFQSFRNVLESLTGYGVVLADMTTIWSKLLEHKSYVSLTGNNINHPNDFGHRLYAQVLYTLLSEPPANVESSEGYQ